MSNNKINSSDVEMYRLCTSCRKGPISSSRESGLDQKWSERTDAETLFKDEESAEMSDSVWPADTNRRIPMGSLHLSRFDFFDVTMKTESSFKT